MKTCKRDFPGVDRETSNQLALDVKTDEQTIIEQIAELRRQSAVSLEAMGYLMGSESRSRKSAQDDKWSFCLTAGTLWPANQERP